MRVAAGKSTLKKNIQMDVSQRLTLSPTAIVVDVSAVIWTLEWPTHGTVATFISEFKMWLSLQLLEPTSTCVSTGITITQPQAATTSRIHQLTLATPLSA